MDMRQFINIVETEGDIEITREIDKVVATLKSYNSMVYTKLAQKMQKIEELESEMKQLKLEVKTETRDHVQALFEAEDKARTRVVDTVSFIFTMSKDPKASETVQYAKVIAELEKHLTPELIAVLQNLKTQFTSVTQKEPSLKISKKTDIKEGVGEQIHLYFTKYKNFIETWGRRYDVKLSKLKQSIGVR